MNQPHNQLDGVLSVVFPAYNEALNMPRLMESAAAVLPTLATDFEIILVDDASSDGTTDLAWASLPENFHSRMKVITHERNRGAGRTVADGLAAATGDFIAYVDSDLQFDLKDLSLLIDKIGSADFIFGMRISRADQWHRKVVSGVYNFIIKTYFGIPYKDLDCGMKLMTRSFLDMISPMLSNSMPSMSAEYFLKANLYSLTVCQVPVPHFERYAGDRKGGRLKPILRALREIYNLSRSFKMLEKKHMNTSSTAP